VRLSARKGILRIYGKGERVREVPIHPELRKALTDWLEERCDWPGAKDGPALFLNQRGHRLSAKGAHDVIQDPPHQRPRLRLSLRRPADRARLPLLQRPNHRSPAMNFTPNSNEAPPFPR
jgi:integrase